MPPTDSRQRPARLPLALATGVLGAALGIAAWVAATASSGSYRSFLAPLGALGAALGVRVFAGRGGRAAQGVGLAITTVALAVGQYLSVSALFHDLARRAGTTPRGRLLPPDLFFAAWAELRDTARECIFLAVCVVLVLWLLRHRPAPRPLP